jgi:hypothetical protein
MKPTVAELCAAGAGACATLVEAIAKLNSMIDRDTAIVIALVPSSMSAPKNTPRGRYNRAAARHARPYRERHET